MFKKTTVLFAAFTMVLGMCLLYGCKDVGGNSSQAQQNSNTEESGSSSSYVFDTDSEPAKETDIKTEDMDESVTIQVESEVIRYKKIVLENDAKKSRNWAKTFKSIIENKLANHYFLSSKDTVELVFKDSPPKKTTVYDHYINPVTGEKKYVNAMIREASVSGNTVSFEYGNNAGSYLESNMNILRARGFQIVCEWDDKKIEYDFVVCINLDFIND